jgi:hypothetical protein
MVSEKQDLNNGEVLPEYDFKGGIRGKHHKAYSRGHKVKLHKTDGTTVVQHFVLQEGTVLLAPDVREYFPDSDAVNKALRALISVAPKKRRKDTEAA